MVVLMTKLAVAATAKKNAVACGMTCTHVTSRRRFLLCLINVGLGKVTCCAVSTAGFAVSATAAADACMVQG